MIIYKTVNLVNGKIYIGQQSTNRKDYLGSGKILQRAIKKYGKENFKKEIIEKCSTKKELNEREIYWIKELNPEYNLHEGGIGGYNKFAVEANKKKKNKTWEKIYSPEGLKKMEKVKKNLIEMGKKYQFQELSKNRRKEIATMGGKATLGTKRSAESRKRISIALKNSEKHKKAMQSEEVRNKIAKSVSKVSKELWKSDDYREKQRLAHKRYYEETPKVKKEDLIRLLESNKSVTEIIYELGVSIPTYYKYKKRYGV